MAAMLYTDQGKRRFTLRRYSDRTGTLRRETRQGSPRGLGNTFFRTEKIQGHAATLYLSYGPEVTAFVTITGNDGRRGVFTILMSGYRIKGSQEGSDGNWKPCKIF